MDLFAFKQCCSLATWLMEDTFSYFTLVFQNIDPFMRLQEKH